MTDYGHSERQEFLRDDSMPFAGIVNGLKYSVGFWLTIIVLLLIW